MELPAVIALIDSGLRLGQTAVEITQRLCAEHGGEPLPTITEFEARVDSLRQTQNLTPEPTK